MSKATLKDLAQLSLTLLVLTAILRSVIQYGFEVSLNSAFAHRDYIGNLLLGLFAYGLCNNLRNSLILSIVLVSGFSLCNAAKLVVLGTPISPDDFIQVRNLFWLWTGWLWVATVIMAILPIAALGYLINWCQSRTWLLIAGVAGLITFSANHRQSITTTLDNAFGHSVWNQPENYSHRGIFLHLIQEGFRTWSKFDNLPDEKSLAALTLPSPLSPIGDGTKRNVHLILLETFFDPKSLGNELVPIDPFPTSFRKLWEQTGQSTTLVPVFGGYTANAEFEVLCGFPVTENAVFFEGWLRRPVPCLPEVLKRAGYSTVASHPNVAGFWNRTNAYPLIGFDHYYDKRYFDLTESVSNILLDHSFYRQVNGLLQHLPEQPVFNYMLTYHGHLPYPSNEEYPETVQGSGNFPLLNGYLSHMYYKSRDFVAEIRRLRQQDPNALIVAFGDHLPFLGPNHEVFTQANKLTPTRDQLNPQQIEYLVQTPLIVIDGQRGPLKLGKVPLYRLPEMILQWLGIEQRGLTHLSQQPEGMIVRPLPGMHFREDEQGIVVICRPPEDDKQSLDPRCEQSTKWLNEIQQYSVDLFSGEQHSLSRLQN